MEREVGVKDGLVWWFEWKHIYPRLYWMAMDYLSIPELLLCLRMDLLMKNMTATSVDVEQTFSQGCLILLHVRSCLSVQSMRVLLCLGRWSKMGLVEDDDVKSAARLPEVDREEEELAIGWDAL